ncbi:UNVERIFIED_CONTAM: hypothetical protein PYX00_005488 [Menopon gallinae]|uniref:G-protein coupled receptors family 2 profile 2 domain-containing protein n=1 Tax=Menopon gallinae TaxID=328185 RepID=A0AAW2HT93_9NEOP
MCGKLFAKFLLLCAIGIFGAATGNENVTHGLADGKGGGLRPRPTLISYGCPSDHNLPCVPKCCDIYESYNNERECATSEDYFFPNFVDCPNMTEHFREISLEQRYEYFIGDPCIKQKYLLDVDEFPEDEHYLYSNGSLWYGNRLLTMEEFCVESVNGTPRVFVCFESQIQAEYKFLLYPIGLLISIPLLVLTAVIYLGIERFRDVQGKSLACHVMCLATAYFFLSLVQLASQELDGDVCIAAAFIIQFFFVACFFWLNVLCYDTYRNISTDYRITSNSATPKSERMKFIYYSMYAWYGPSILTIVSLVMDLTPTIPELYLKPKFGIQSCWFESDAAALPYFYGPVGVLILLNVIFFALSTRKIYKEQKNYVKLKGTNDSKDKLPPKFRVYVRALKRCISLFCVMGINWAAEVISWVIGGSEMIWLITDIFNTLQGLIIFYIYVIKPRSVRTEVLERLHSLCNCRCFGQKRVPSRGNQYFQAPVNEEDSKAYCGPNDRNIPYIDASAWSLTSV